MIINKKNRKVPIFDYISSSFDTDFSRTILISVHHIIEIDYRLIQYLIRNGFKPNHLHILGKSYSTNIKTYEKYKEIGVNIDKNSLSFFSNKTFDCQFQEYCKNFIQKVENKLRKTVFDKIIVYDDGGSLLEIVNQLIQNPNSFFYNKKIVGIEHTSGGYNKLSNKKLNLPILNVARSKTKLELETPYIIKSCLKEIPKSKLKHSNILIIGGGYLGKEFGRILLKDNYVTILDKEDYYKIKEITFKKYDLILCSTGEENILSLELIESIKTNCYLISVSSSDREFPMNKIRQKLNIENSIHDSLVFNNVIILNNGFPINFTGKEVVVPLKYIQLSVGLAYFSIIYANNEYSSLTDNTFITIDEKFQKELTYKFNSLIKKKK